MSKEEQFKKDVKEILLQGNNTIGIAISSKRLHPSKAMPKKMFELGKKFGLGFPADIIYHERGQGGGTDYKVCDTGFCIIRENSPDWHKKIVKKREKKLSKFQKKVSNCKDGKYDREGTILIPKYSTNTGYSHEPDKKPEEPRFWVSGYIRIEMTQRELAEAEILPEDFEWIENVRVSPKDIAEVDKERELNMTEVGGVKGFIKKILDKFRGIGEK